MRQYYGTMRLAVRARGVPDRMVISGEPRSLTDTPRRRSPAVSEVRPPAPHSLQAGGQAQGISDTYALGVLAETTGLGIPIVVLPFVNTALASRQPFRRSVEALRAEGVSILLGPAASSHTHHTRAAASSTATPGTSPWTKPNACSAPPSRRTPPLAPALSNPPPAHP